MATIRREFALRAAPAKVWAALRDFGCVHQVLAAGFVTDCVLEEEGRVRALTFANGIRARERLVGVDEVHMRLAYTAEGGRATHHHASAEVVAEAGGCRLVWITDVLPDTLAPTIEAMMDAGVDAMRRTLEAQTAHGA